jgi:signal transduction histidine kinase
MGLKRFWTGYRFRVYSFAALMLVLVAISFGLSVGLAWYSKYTTSWIVSREFKTRNNERQIFDLLLSMDLDRKRYFILEKPEYRQLFLEHQQQVGGLLRELGSLSLSDTEREILGKLQSDLDSFLLGDPFLRKPATVPGAEDFPGVPLQRVRDLLQLGQGETDSRLRQMNALEKKIVGFGIYWSGVSLAGVVALSFLLIRSITRQIDLLREGIQEVTGGRFHHQVPLKSRDELGEVMAAFNEMAQELKRVDEMKSEFMAVVSHELKTPLTSMKEAVELLLEEAVGPVNPKQRHLLNIHAEGIQKLSGYVEEILSLTRMEGGLIDLNRTWFDFRDLVEGKLSTFKLLADRKRIRLSAVFQPRSLPRIYGDAERIKNVLANLLSNAIRFTPAGGQVCAHVEYHGSLEGVAPKRWVEVRVTDTGEGIPPEEWKRIFDKFYQVQDASQRGSGSGLGLSIAKHIIEAHGGSIWVEESSATGTTFAFMLPQDLDPARSGARPAAGAEEQIRPVG